jgi:hypothetical protein
MKWLVQGLRFALSTGPNRVDPVSETVCFPVFRIPNNGQSPEAQKFWKLQLANSNRSPVLRNRLKLDNGTD